MNTIWLLIAISSGSYNRGNVTSVEFADQRACIVAREQIKQVEQDSLATLCVPKSTK